MSEALLAVHDFEEQCSIDGPLRVSVGRHVSGVTPLDFPDEAAVQQLTEPSHMSKQGLFSRRLEVLAR